MRKNTFILKTILILTLPILALSQTVLPLEQTVSLSQDMSSTLRTEIHLTSPSEITIYVKDWESTYNWDTDYDRVYIYNSADTVIEYNQFASESDPFLFHMIGDSVYLSTRVGQEGTYYIDFHSGNDWGWPEGKTTQNYTVKVSALPVDDAYEPNDDFAGAATIALNQSLTAFQWKRTATSSVEGDEDWYKINLPSPGILNVKVTDWLSVYNWGTDYDRFYIYNADAIPIDGYSAENPYFSAMFQDTPDGIDINLTSGGIYYLRFHSGNAYKTEPYSLAATFTAVNDQFEPNDQLADAASINFDTPYQAYQWRSLGANDSVWADEDYYAVSVAEAGKLTVSVSNGWNSVYNWGTDYDRLYFYDANGNQIGASGNAPNASMFSDTETSVNLPASGKYIIRLHSGNAYSENPYEVTFKFKALSGIDDEKTLPLEFELSQNYPNPFNPATTIRYQLPAGGMVTLKIYDLHGAEITELINKQQAPGYYEVNFDAPGLASGNYFYVLKINNLIKTKRMLLLK